MTKYPKRKACSAPGCGREAHARGLCQMHYDRTRKRQSTRRLGPGQREGLEPSFPVEEDAAQHELAGAVGRGGQTSCSVPGCGAPHHAKGYCKSHYSRLRRRGRMRSSSASDLAVCEVAGCSNPVVRNRRCGDHLGDKIPGGVRHMTKGERLAEIRRRHELMRREIERIRQSFEREREEDG